MRTGYAIRDKREHAWLATRTLEDDMGGSLTVWVQSDEDAMIFRKLPDAKRMLKAVRADSRCPEAIRIIDPRWREGSLMQLVDLIAGAMVTAGAATVIGIIGIVLTRSEERENETEVARATRTSSDRLRRPPSP